MKFIAFGGDGGTYDIGLQSLSGAMERGHDMVYVCYDNGAYMNTGIQRSSATPLGAWATTAEVGKAQQGKIQRRKDLTSIIADHGVPYAAQASVSHWRDLTTKAEKAFAVDGPAFLNVLSPCPRGWRTQPNQSIEIAKSGVQTGFWPLFEVEDGVWRQTVKVANRKPVVEFLKPQGRFKHLFAPGNEELLARVQDEVDRYWDYVERRCAQTA
jgi:pyruvate ferredoxin oxidoreductase beta subunit